MTRNEPDTPPAVQEARRRVRNVSIGTTALSLAIIPLVWGAKVVGIDPNVAEWGAMAVGAAVYLARWARDADLIREHNRLIARTDLGSIRQRDGSQRDHHQSAAADGRAHCLPRRR